MTVKSSSAKSTATIFAPSLEELSAQIRELMDQRNEIISKEKDAVILELKEKISLYGLTPEEIGFPPLRGKRGRPAKDRDYQEPSAMILETEVPEDGPTEEHLNEMAKKL